MGVGPLSVAMFKLRVPWEETHEIGRQTLRGMDRMRLTTYKTLPVDTDDLEPAGRALGGGFLDLFRGPPSTRLTATSSKALALSTWWAYSRPPSSRWKSKGQAL